MLFKADLRSNIIFDNRFDHSLFNRVLDLVDLNYDIANNSEFEKVESEFG